MKRQICKMTVNGITYIIVQDDNAKVNPLRVVKKAPQFDAWGRFVKQTQLTLDRYADFNSCMCRIMSDINHKSMTIVPFEAFYGK